MNASVAPLFRPRAVAHGAVGERSAAQRFVVQALVTGSSSAPVQSAKPPRVERPALRPGDHDDASLPSTTVSCGLGFVGRVRVKLAPNILAVIESDAARATVEILLGALGRETTTLTAAGDAREDAITALAAFDIERRQLLRDTIALIADTEVGILTVHRGRRDLVDRVLALDFDSDGSKPKKTAPPTPA